MTSSPVQFVQIGPSEYDVFYQQYLSVQNGRPEHFRKLILSRIQQAIQDSSSNLAVLSVGAGFGDFEDYLFPELNRHIGYYQAVEPSKEYCDTLTRKCKESWKVDKFQIDQDFFKPNYSFNAEKFDIVFFFHVLYYVQSPADCLEEITKNYLRSGGIIVVVQLGQVGQTKVVKEMFKFLQIEQSIDYHRLCAQDLYDQLCKKSSNDEFELDIVSHEGAIDVTAIVEDEQPRGNHILSFFMQMDVEKSNATSDQVQQLRQIIKEASDAVQGDNGSVKYLLKNTWEVLFIKKK